MSLVMVGVDPGMVHTGVVRVAFDSKKKTIKRKCAVIDGLDMEAVADWVEKEDPWRVFVEKYRQRMKLSADPDMMAAERRIKELIPSAVVMENMGIHKVVPVKVMEIMGLWSFPVHTHHQDLRSAARIMVKGMLREDIGNWVVSEIVQHHLHGIDWEIGDWE